MPWIGFVPASAVLFAVAARLLGSRRALRDIVIGVADRRAALSASSRTVSASTCRSIRSRAGLRADGPAAPRLRVALTPVQSLVGARRRDARHRGRRAARHRSGADRRAAAAGHLQSRSNGRAHHVRRHLLRRDVRRIDDLDSAEHAGRERHDGHRHRRTSDGARRAVPARRSRRRRSDRSSPARCPRSRLSLAAPVARPPRAGVRARRVLRADGARVRDGVLDARPVAPARARQACFIGLTLGVRRHRRLERRSAFHVRHPLSARRHRCRHRRRRPLRGRRGAHRARRRRCRRRSAAGRPAHLDDARRVVAIVEAMATRHGDWISARRVAGRRRGAADAALVRGREASRRHTRRNSGTARSRAWPARKPPTTPPPPARSCRC